MKKLDDSINNKHKLDYSFSNLIGETDFNKPQEKYVIGRIISDLDFLRTQFDYNGYTSNHGKTNSYAMINDITTVNNDGVQNQAIKNTITTFVNQYVAFIPDSTSIGVNITIRINLISHLKFKLQKYLNALNVNKVNLSSI